MSAHTPGPWVARQEYANRWRIEVPLEGCVPVSVAIVTTTVLEVGANDKDTASNARLIAAAPELLEALHNLEVSANTVAGCYSRNPGRFAEALKGLGEYAEAARAVIAKAEGAPS